MGEPQTVASQRRPQHPRLLRSSSAVTRPSPDAIADPECRALGRRVLGRGGAAAARSGSRPSTTAVICSTASRTRGSCTVSRRSQGTPRPRSAIASPPWPSALSRETPSRADRRARSLRGSRACAAASSRADAFADEIALALNGSTPVPALIDLASPRLASSDVLLGLVAAADRPTTALSAAPASS